jgi:hypothetical protein
MKKATEDKPRIAPALKAPLGGGAGFSIEVFGHTLTMRGASGSVREVQMNRFDQYDELHDLVMAKIKSIAETSFGATNKGAPSTRNLAAIPKPARLRELMRALALLDAILEPEWESRGYSFDAAWGSEQLGSWRDGSGDWFLVWFAGPDSAVIKGFGHESEMTPFKRRDETPWPGLFDGLPDDLSYARDMREFPPEEVTYCIWHPEGGEWTIGPVRFPEGIEDPDASELHLRLLDNNPDSYVKLIKEEWEGPLDIETAAVRAIYGGEKLNWDIVSRINRKADPQLVVREALQMGYPVFEVFAERMAERAAEAASAKRGKKQAVAPKGKRTKR